MDSINSKKIPLVYIGGPYRCKTREGTQRNIESALQVARFVAAKGWMPVVPQAMTPLFDWDYREIQTDEFWLAGTMEVMKRCDAVVLCPGWSFSEGTLKEIEVAEKLGIKIYKTLEHLPCHI